MSLKNLEDIYVKLCLLDECKGSGDSREISYEKLLATITDAKTRTRTLLLGEAGAGKSTLLVKIAHDWAKGKCLQTIDLLFHVSHRESEKNPYYPL